MSSVNNDVLTQNNNRDSALHLAVDVDNGAEVTRLLDEAEQSGCLKEFLSLKDVSGNTALGSGLFAGKKKAIKAIITKIATNSDLLQEALSASNVYGDTVLEVIIAQGAKEIQAYIEGYKDPVPGIVETSLFEKLYSASDTYVPLLHGSVFLVGCAVYNYKSHAATEVVDNA